jgi:trimeric autotransporter adhesin
MKKSYLLSLVGIVLLNAFAFSQNTAITDDDSYNAHPSAMLDVKSVSKGILIPRLTTAQRVALTATATNGLMVYDASLNRFFFYNGTTWMDLATPESQIWGFDVIMFIYLIQV